VLFWVESKVNHLSNASPVSHLNKTIRLNQQVLFCYIVTVNVGFHPGVYFDEDIRED
jgi:hypothetical protein